MALGCHQIRPLQASPTRSPSGVFLKSLFGGAENPAELHNSIKRLIYEFKIGTHVDAFA
jgi:hypothetical protein